MHTCVDVTVWALLHGRYVEWFHKCRSCTDCIFIITFSIYNIWRISYTYKWYYEKSFDRVKTVNHLQIRCKGADGGNLLRRYKVYMIERTLKVWKVGLHTGRNNTKSRKAQVSPVHYVSYCDVSGNSLKLTGCLNIIFLQHREFSIAYTLIKIRATIL